MFDALLLLSHMILKHVMPFVIATTFKDYLLTVFPFSGVDPSTLEKTAHSIVRDPSRISYSTAESLLDIIQGKLKLLKEYKDTEEEPEKPETLRDQAYYMGDLKEGTYKYVCSA